MSTEEAGRARRELWCAAALCLFLGLVYGLGVQRDQAWGWDESMHAELPAARMLVSVQDGELGLAAEALHDCMQYPFGWPLALAAVQALTGISELACRVAGRLFWAGGLFGLFLLVRAAAQRAGPRPGGDLAPWLALGFAASSPLAWAFSGTLFLEAPFTVVSIYALHAWLRRGAQRPLSRELIAGALLTAGFFIKFNYGLLLGFGLFLVLLVEGAGELRAGRSRSFLRRSAMLALAPALGFGWWLLLPLPLGAETAALHREALVAFLQGNTDASMRSEWFRLPLNMGVFLVWAPRVLAFLCLCALASLPRWRERSVWTLWLCGLACTLPVLLHPFHHDRFLLPGSVFLWALAALGLAPLLPHTARGRASVLTPLALGLALFPSLDSHALLRGLGLADGGVSPQQEAILADFRDLSPDRDLNTNGLARAEVQGLLDLLEPELRADDRVGWVGMTQNFSPAAMHVGLVARGAGSRAELTRGRLDESFITIEDVDPGWDRERLGTWAQRFTLILCSEPVDMVQNPSRLFLRSYRDQLAESGAFERRSLGQVTIERPKGRIPVELFALRPLGSGR